MKVLLLDIDGCLNLEYPSIILNKNTELIKRDPYGEKIWDLFEASTKNMRAKPQFLPYYYNKSFRKKFDVIYIVTARPEKWRPQTERWLKKWKFEYDWLYMRPNDMMTLESYKLKEFLLKKYILNKFPANEIGACDDDLSICSMYERHGISAYQTPVDWPLLIRDLKLKYPNLTEEQKPLLEHYLIKEYKKGKTLRSLAEELGYSYRSLLSLKSSIDSATLHIKPKKRYKRIDIEAFKHLDTETAAYFAGFAASDATIELSSGTPVIKWDQQDADLLHELKKRLGADQKVKGAGDSGNFAIAQNSLVNLLVYRWGITPTKDLTLKFPKKIPHTTVHHFIRGVYDGDGSFYKKENGSAGQFILCSGSLDFLSGISDLYKKLRIEHKIDKTSGTNDEGNQYVTYSLKVAEKHTDKLFKFLYKDATIFLERKRESAETFLNKR